MVCINPPGIQPVHFYPAVIPAFFLFKPCPGILHYFLFVREGVRPVRCNYMNLMAHPCMLLGQVAFLVSQFRAVKPDKMDDSHESAIIHMFLNILLKEALPEKSVWASILRSPFLE